MALTYDSQETLNEKKYHCCVIVVVEVVIAVCGCRVGEHASSKTCLPFIQNK